MRFLRLTQADTGVTIHVSMDRGVVIAPDATGGAVLLATALDGDAPRMMPVKGSPHEVVALLDAAPART